MNAEHARGLREVAAAVGDDALAVLPFDSRQRLRQTRERSTDRIQVRGCAADDPGGEIGREARPARRLSSRFSRSDSSGLAITAIRPPAPIESLRSIRALKRTLTLLPASLP